MHDMWPPSRCSGRGEPNVFVFVLASSWANTALASSVLVADCQWLTQASLQMGTRGIYIWTIIFKRWRCLDQLRAVLFCGVIAPPGVTVPPYIIYIRIVPLYIYISCSMPWMENIIPWLFRIPWAKTENCLLPWTASGKICSANTVKLKFPTNTILELVKSFPNWKDNLE